MSDPVMAPSSERDLLSSPSPAGLRVRIFARTDVGQVREHNEDNFLVADLSTGSRGLLEANRGTAIGPRGALFAVCDGMGGAAAGEVASQLAVDTLFERMMDASSTDAKADSKNAARGNAEQPTHRDEIARRLVHAVETAGSRIFQEAKADRSRRGMGTTTTAAALVDDHLFLAQVGDSRGYILRGETLVQVTRDQSLVNQLIEAGQLTEEEAENFEHNNIILQALGTSDTVQVDLTYTVIRRGDILLLCSDGLSGMVRFDEIRELLRSSTDPLDICKALTERANQSGGHDNITVIVVEFEGPDLIDATATDAPKYQKYALPEADIDGAATEPRQPSLAPDSIRMEIEPPEAPRHASIAPSAGDNIDEPVDIPGTRIPVVIVVLLILAVIVLLVATAIVLIK